MTGFDSAKAGNITMTVSYTEGEITKTATFKLTIKAKGTTDTGSEKPGQNSSADPADPNASADHSSQNGASGNTNTSNAQTRDTFPVEEGITLGIICLVSLGALLILKRKDKVR